MGSRRGEKMQVCPRCSKAGLYRPNVGREQRADHCICRYCGFDSRLPADTQGGTDRLLPYEARVARGGGEI